MMTYQNMKKSCTFFVSITMLLLCTFILSNFSNVWAKESEKAVGQQLSDIVEFTGITLYQEGDGNQWEQVSTGDLLQKDTALFLAYTYTITDEEKIEKIQANTPYYLNVSPHLILPNLGDAGEVLKLTDSEGVEVTFGYLHSDGTNAWLEFTEPEDAASGYETVIAEYEGLTSAHFYLECKRAGTPPANDIEESTENNCFVMKFENGEKLEFGYWELVPQYADAKVEKSGTRNGETKAITWTVEYFPMQNPSGTNGITADTAFELRDVIDTTAHTLQKDSLRINNVPVTVSDSRAEIQADADTYAFVEMDGNNATLVIGGKVLKAGKAKQGETITSLNISYQTEIVDTLLLKPIETSNNGAQNTKNAIMLLANEANSGVDIENEVLLYAEIDGTFTSMEIGASDTVNIPKLEWITKEGKTERQYDNSIIGSITTWEVTFNPNGFTFDAGSNLTLHDQLPEHSTLDENSVEVTIGSSKVELPVTMDKTNNSFTVSGITTSGEWVTVTYKTTVSEDAYNSGQDLGENVAWFTFTNDGSSYTTSKAKDDVGDGSGGLGISPLVKSNSGYNHATRSVIWTVTINPHKADFTKGSFIDDLKDVGGFAPHEHTNGLELVGDANDIEIKINDAVVTSGEDKVKVEYDTAERIIKVEVGEIGRNTVTLTYTTKICDPCLFANNVDNAGLTNKIATTDMVIGEKQVATKENPRIAESQVIFSVGMLKKNAPIYDYRTGEMIWTVEVNDNNLPLTGICLTDVLPAGLRYVEDSIEISNNINGIVDTTDENGRQEMTIRLDDFNTKTIVTFRTKVDWGVMDFDGSATEMNVSNTINIKGFADGVEFTESNTVSRTFVNHGLVKSDRMVDTDNEMIEYEVLINPYRLKLPKSPALVDTLDPRLQLDWDTLRLYKATLNGDSGDGTKKPDYSYEESDLIQALTVADYDAKKNQFTVELPIPSGGENGIYVLCYTADIIDFQTGSYGNSISFRGSTSLFGGEKDNTASVSGGGGGGGGGGVVARKATILITKTDEKTGQPLQGVTFVLYSWDSKTGQRGMAFSQAETDENGKLSFRGLKPGAKYELVETTPKFGYSSTFVCKTASESSQIEWTNDGKCIITAGGKGSKLELELTNKEKGKDVVCKLMTEDGVPLAGEQVELNPVDDEGNSTGSSLQEEVLTDGTVIFPDVRPGKYQLIDAGGNVIVIIEVSADASTITAALPDNSIVNLDNPLIGNLSANRKIWKLTVKKVDADERTPLPGAVFALYAENDCKTMVQQKKTSGADGMITFSGLIEGQTYYLKELTAPDGYQLEAAVYEVDKDSAQQVVENVRKSSNKPDTPEKPVNPGNPGEKEDPENPSEEEIEDAEEEKPENPGEKEDPENPSEEEIEDTEGEKPENSEKKEESKNPVGSESAGKDSEISSTWEGESFNTSNEEDSPYLDPDHPKTGDKTWLFGLVFLISGFLLLGLTIYKIWMKKHHEQE